jgi:hypothetical protein
MCLKLTNRKLLRGERVESFGSGEIKQLGIECGAIKVDLGEVKRVNRWEVKVTRWEVIR